MEHAKTPPPSSAPKAGRLPKILPWMILMLATLGMLFWVERGCGAGLTKNTQSADTSGSPDTSARNSGQTFGGTGNAIDTLDPYATFPTGFEVLISTEGMTTPTHCFILDKVWFKPGTAELASVSEAQLNELQQLMKAYPKVVLGLEGHSGSATDEAVNEAYAQQKSDAIRAWLVARGIPGDRILASAWGSRNPRYKDGSEKARRLNERVEACVVSKN